MVMLGIIATVFGMFFFLTNRLNAPSMALLYSDLSMSDAGRIIAKLDTTNTPYELRGNGTAIMVPSDQVARLRMSIAQEGMPWKSVV